MPYCLTAEKNYEKIKTLIAQKKPLTTVLERIKNDFKEEISSPRLYGSIKTLAELIGCLERIDVLSKCNVDPLSQIAAYFADDEISMALEKYEEPPEDDDVNIYALQRTKERNHKIEVADEDEKPKIVQYVQQQQSVIVPEFTERKRMAVYKVIAQEIGRNWRSFGRELGVRAGDLDRIELKYISDLESKVFEIFAIFEKNPRYNSKEHFYRICDALDQVKRRDLHRTVHKVLINDDLY